MKLKRLLLLLFISVSLFGCASNSNLADDKNDTDVKTEYLSGKYYVEMDIKDYGVIDLELDADIAPITVTNFIDLVNKKFYDGLTFHRIIKNFMVQGGDPEGTGMGGSGTTIKGEFLNNGVKNSISHFEKPLLTSLHLYYFDVIFYGNLNREELNLILLLPN